MKLLKFYSILSGKLFLILLCLGESVLFIMMLLLVAILIHYKFDIAF